MPSDKFVTVFQWLLLNPVTGLSDTYQKKRRSVQMAGYSWHTCCPHCSLEGLLLNTGNTVVTCPVTEESWPYQVACDSKYYSSFSIHRSQRWPLGRNAFYFKIHWWSTVLQLKYQRILILFVGRGTVRIEDTLQKNFWTW